MLPGRGGHVHIHILCFMQIWTLGMWYLNNSYILDSIVFKSERREENILILHKYHVEPNGMVPVGVQLRRNENVCELTQD